MRSSPSSSKRRRGSRNSGDSWNPRRGTRPAAQQPSPQPKEGHASRYPTTKSPTQGGARVSLPNNQVPTQGGARVPLPNNQVPNPRTQGGARVSLPNNQVHNQGGARVPLPNNQAYNPMTPRGKGSGTRAPPWALEIEHYSRGLTTTARRAASSLFAPDEFDFHELGEFIFLFARHPQYEHSFVGVFLGNRCLL